MAAPPHNTEAEQAVLGALLLDAESVEVVRDVLTPSDFFTPAHVAIYDVIRKLVDKGVALDTVTIVDALKDSEALQDVGGMSYVGALLEGTPTAANVAHYTRIVKEKAVGRWMISQASELINTIRDGGDITELFDKTQAEYAKPIFGSTEPYLRLKDIVGDVFGDIEALSESGGLCGISTGFKDIDEYLGGFQKGHQVVIAGRPSMGKSALALNLALKVAQGGGKVGFFPIEVGHKELVKNMLAKIAGVDTRRLHSGGVKGEEWNGLMRAVGNLYELPIAIDDTPQTARDIARQARRMKAKEGLDIIFVDYLQLLSGGGGRGENREQELAGISRTLKLLAKELDITSVLISQLSRRVEAREDKRPILADLRESGAIEQDADVVLFIYREEYYRRDTTEKNVAEVIVAKQRNGPTGTRKLTWYAPHLTFKDYTSD